VFNSIPLIRDHWGDDKEIILARAKERSGWGD